jgi:glycosyltransferase involved in cell wall biosynthesis
MTGAEMIMTRNSRSAMTSSSGPLISVIICNHNYETFIGDAIRSVLEQTYTKVECIVVDDGSTDGSREIISCFANIKTIFQKNAGQSGAARAGLGRATGDIVLFLDSDDFLLPDATAMIAGAWRPGVAALLFKLRVMKDGIVTDGLLPEEPFLRDDILKYIRAYGYYPAAPTSGNAYAANVARKIFANAVELTDRCFFDSWMILCSPFFGDVVAVHRPLGVYRIHDANASMVASRTLRRIKSQVYYIYWAQRSAARFSSPHGPEKWSFLKGPYWLKWYILTRDIGEPDFNIPDYSMTACIWECCREFLTFPAITMRNRLANCLIVVGYRALPRAARTWIIRRLYRIDG